MGLYSFPNNTYTSYSFDGPSSLSFNFAATKAGAALLVFSQTMGYPNPVYPTVSGGSVTAAGWTMIAGNDQGVVPTGNNSETLSASIFLATAASTATGSITVSVGTSVYPFAFFIMEVDSLGSGWSHGAAVGLASPVGASINTPVSLPGVTMVSTDALYLVSVAGLGETMTTTPTITSGAYVWENPNTTGPLYTPYGYQEFTGGGVISVDWTGGTGTTDYSALVCTSIATPVPQNNIVMWL